MTNEREREKERASEREREYTHTLNDWPRCVLLKESMHTTERINACTDLYYFIGTAQEPLVRRILLIHESSYYYTRSMRASVSSYYYTHMCPHTAIQRVLILFYAFSLPTLDGPRRKEPLMRRRDEDRDKKKNEFCPKYYARKCQDT